jgi:hypothetical protein
MLFFFTRNAENHSEPILSLPKWLSLLMDQSQKSHWFNAVFQDATNVADFNDFERDCSRSHGLPPVLLDIVFISQCLAPGLILICWHEGFEAGIKQIRARALPPADWFNKHSDMVREILSNAHIFNQLEAEIIEGSKGVIDMTAVGELVLQEEFEEHSRSDDSDPRRRMEGVLFWDDHDSDGRDYEYCDLECGYCGRCADPQVSIDFLCC